MQNEYDFGEEWVRLEPRARGGLWIPLFLLLSLLACAFASVFVPGGLGLLAGYGQLQAQNHENAIQHFQRGLGFLAEGYPELANTEFEIAIRYDGSYEPAREKLRELQGALGASGTPGAQEQDRVAAALFDEANDLASRKQWSDAINRLEQLRALNPGYRSAEASDLLYQAYVASGHEAKAAGQIEMARERFDDALAIRSADQAVLRQRDLAMLYLDGQQAAGYNWKLAIEAFSELYRQDPKYYDVAARLVNAYTQYGDLAAKQGAWCLAVREYDGALAVTKDSALAEKRAQTMALCRQAVLVTPSPSPVAGTENYIAQIAAGAGKVCNTGTGDIGGTVRDAFGQPIVNAPVAYDADGIARVTTRTNANGQYQFVLGAEPGLFHVVVLSVDGKSPAGVAADVAYPGANKPGCRITVDWQKVR